jgi:hypothetical protein
MRTYIETTDLDKIALDARTFQHRQYSLLVVQGLISTDKERAVAKALGNHERCPPGG